LPSSGGQTAIDMVKAQFAGFEKFIRMVKGAGANA
jgi:hypothetical protein